MKLNEERLDELIHDALKEEAEKQIDIKPTLSQEEMWMRLENKIQSGKQKRKGSGFRRIPVFASSLIALAASLFFVLNIPVTSDIAKEQNDEKIVTIEKTMENLTMATKVVEEEVAVFSRAMDETSLTMEDEITLNDYPLYLPSGYVLEKEEQHEDMHVLYYLNGVDVLVVHKIYGENAIEIEKVQVENEVTNKANGVGTDIHRVTKKTERVSVVVEGILSEIELMKVADSVFPNN